MIQPRNEFKYKADTGKTYIVYFLKFWPATDKKNDYIVKYQIRESERDFVWYGRIAKDRFLADTKNTAEGSASKSKEELENKIKNYLQKIFTYVTKKALDKGFEEPNTEFVFYKKPPIAKRTWCDTQI